MAGINFYKRYMGDYGRDTADLSQGEHGAYNLLMDWYYSTGGPIPADERSVFMVARAFTPEEQENARRVVARYFRLDGNRLRLPRADLEIARLRRFGEAAAQNGRRGAEKQRGKPRSEPDAGGVANGVPDGDAAGDADGAQPEHQIPDTKFVDTPPTPRGGKASAPTDPDDASYTEAFNRWWKAYPNKTGKWASFQKWQRLRIGADAVLVEKIIQHTTKAAKEHGPWLRGYIPLGTTYLNGRRWTDPIEPLPPSAQQARAQGQQPAPSKQANGLRNLQGLKSRDRDDDEESGADARLVSDGDRRGLPAPRAGES